VLKWKGFYALRRFDTIPTQSGGNNGLISTVHSNTIYLLYNLRRQKACLDIFTPTVTSYLSYQSILKYLKAIQAGGLSIISRSKITTFRPKVHGNTLSLLCLYTHLPQIARRQCTVQQSTASYGKVPHNTRGKKGKSRNISRKLTRSSPLSSVHADHGRVVRGTHAWRPDTKTGHGIRVQVPGSGDSSLLAGGSARECIVRDSSTTVQTDDRSFNITSSL
jgi:hypothetical protein